ncbi:hypothetical protein PAXRUDRAFT_220695 [Paxillus rubicundulus Ve08.2h10]|uniref:Uncharacterized protein n=1 Tax=Paxillus rubicundulus Ve08.2h10 TaxID=930991 RepID=A0A0D0DTX2_9AGAM|nr:hypothetical protein PAXRUDRAFT_220695 [Paxillus rubicundulus Ve08.2h10]
MFEVRCQRTTAQGYHQCYGPFRKTRVWRGWLWQYWPLLRRIATRPGVACKTLRRLVAFSEVESCSKCSLRRLSNLYDGGCI